MRCCGASAPPARRQVARKGKRISPCRGRWPFRCRGAPELGLFRRAFGFVGRIRKGEDDRTGIELRRRFHHVFGERAAVCADSDDADILLRPGRQRLLDFAALRDGPVDVVRPATDFAAFETGGGDRRVADDRNEAGRVAGDDFEEQRLAIVREAA